MMYSSAHVTSLMVKIEEHNQQRAYQRRVSASCLLQREEPILISIYRQDESTKFGFSLRGGARHSVVDMTTSRGQYIRSVDLDSPADQAGLKAGDRILAVNDVPCEGECHEVVRDLVAASSSPLRLLVLRDEVLASQAKDTTSAMVLQEFKEVINEQTGMPTVTAEMKGSRLGRTRKCMERLLHKAKSEDFTGGMQQQRQSRSRHSH
eukprot:m.76757 g.76757  ORF g.76757 m.76757 type:complete len:207 (-) comp14040_c2_seq1:201-821(-)